MSTVESMTDARNDAARAITSMASHVEGMVDDAIDALLTLNADLAARILRKEVVANALEMHIDQVIQTSLEQGSLGSSEIRRLVALLKINKDLERVGDLAANIGRRVSSRKNDGKSRQDFSSLQPLAIAVSHLAKKTLRALARRDLMLATNALGETTRVDAYRDHVLHHLHQDSERAAGDAGNLDLLLASRHLEQIADHCTNVAESLIFWLGGRKHCSSESESRVAV
jgi:phosphate transport system protein